MASFNGRRDLDSLAARQQGADYLAPDGKMMAVPIAVNGAALDVGAPEALFQTRIVGGTNIDLGRQYDVASDGRFLINVATDDATSPITLILNWAAGAKP